MSDLCALMRPYFDRLESAVLAIAAERNDELIRDIFQNERWHLSLVEGAPKAGRNLTDHENRPAAIPGAGGFPCDFNR
jgi:hypothetical protein